MAKERRPDASKPFRIARPAVPDGDEAGASPRHGEGEAASMATDSERLSKRIDDLRGHVNTRADGKGRRMEDPGKLIAEQGKAQRRLIVEQGKLLRRTVGLPVGVALGAVGLAIRIFLPQTDCL